MLDNLSYLSLENQSSDFPIHFHETYCISFITKGVEKLIINDSPHFAEPGSITITQPYEVHEQPLMDQETGSGFQTIYVSPDLVKFYSGQSNTPLLPRKIIDHQIQQRHGQLLAAIQSGVNTEHALQAFVNSLSPFMTKGSEIGETEDKWVTEVRNYIDHHVSEKIDLNRLSKISGLGKFTFAKRFRAQTGLSPIHYVLMRKVYSARADILPETNLTQLAYHYDFSDMAHFSHTFKRYIGLTPSAYKKQVSR